MSTEEKERPTRRLFGTDGIRGVANREPMTSETALRLGRAVAHVFRDSPYRHKILIGKDTRLSGYMLETAMASGICSMGVDVLLVGPMPTPGIAFLTRSLRADAGAVISGSHNPFADNGIKFFSRDGFKLPDAAEHSIEQVVLDPRVDHVRPTADNIGKAFRIDDALGRYNVFVKNTFPRDLTLDGLRIVVDCAHGAAYRVAPEVLEELGATVIATGVEPDGLNINQDTGALHPAGAARLVRERGAHVGLALDGDGDRAILIDERGTLVDGDGVLAICAREMHGAGTLHHATIVATLMSNLGLEVGLAEHGIRVVKAAVGDRYVVEAMLEGGYNFGGEQSGHIVFLDHTTTGDGLITFLAVLAIMVHRGRSLADLTSGLLHFPQVLRNVHVRDKPELMGLRPVEQAVRAAQEDLGQRGRVLVRYSGTEALARVMVEGEHEDRVRRWADAIAAAIGEAIGSGEEEPLSP